MADIDELYTEFQEFREQYDKDMRGDMEVTGDKGLVNTVRDIKKCQEENPSLLFLLRHKTASTVGAITAVLYIFYSIYFVIQVTIGFESFIESVVKTVTP
jgi:hypothetical protein